MRWSLKLVSSGKLHSPPPGEPPSFAPSPTLVLVFSRFPIATRVRTETTATHPSTHITVQQGRHRTVPFHLGRCMPFHQRRPFTAVRAVGCVRYLQCVARLVQLQHPPTTSVRHLASSLRHQQRRWRRFRVRRPFHCRKYGRHYTRGVQRGGGVVGTYRVPEDVNGQQWCARSGVVQRVVRRTR
jgi:hypothetical protein